MGRWWSQSYKKNNKKAQTEIKQKNAIKEPQDSIRKKQKTKEAQSQQPKHKKQLDNNKLPFSCIPRLEEQYKDISFDKLGPK